MELFCRRKYVDHILGHDALPYSVPFRSSPTLLPFLSRQEGNLHRASLQRNGMQSLHFVAFCLDLEILVLDGPGPGEGGQPLRKDSVIKGGM